MQPSEIQGLSASSERSYSRPQLPGAWGDVMGNSSLTAATWAHLDREAKGGIQNGSGEPAEFGHAL